MPKSDQNPEDGLWIDSFLINFVLIDTENDWLTELYRHQNYATSQSTLKKSQTQTKAAPVQHSLSMGAPSKVVNQPRYSEVSDSKKTVANPVPLKPPVNGYVEGAVIYGHLTNGYGIWFNQYVKAFAQVDPKNAVGLLLANDYEFNQHGDYAVADQIHIINEEWYTHVGMGISNHSFFVPKYYIGGSVFRKLLLNRPLIAYLGAHAYWWRPVASNQDINPGVIYYFQKPWIVELGAFFNRSEPGTVYSASGYVVLTEGRVKDHFFILRFGFGREAYVPLGSNIPGVLGFPSTVVTATWRQWWGKNWGTNMVGENYNNPFYKRYGVNIGLFMDFSV